jgi:HSP20 family protein
MNAVSLCRPNTIQNALSDFDRYFESFFGDSLMTPAAKIFSRLPAVDILETENAYFLEIDLPGYDEKNIEVHLDGASLTVSSKHEDEKKKKEEGENGIFLLRERRLSSFSRSFKLPENADPETVNAAFKKGILSLEIKKRPEAQKRTITINAD